MSRMRYFIFRNVIAYNYLYLFLLLTIILCSCANQLPPPGGEDDTIPPKVISITPKPNTINFKEKSIVIEFDEYVDRRSFEESIFISPKPKGEISYNWSGTEVEIEFDKQLDIGKTYTFVINKDLKDARGGNSITEPIKFAVSTGSSIDKGEISGKVYTDNIDRVLILAYILTSENENDIDPSKKVADYVIQVNSTGNYTFENLPSKKFRLFALKDYDRNLLYDKGFDEIAVLSQDLFVNDTIKINNADFLLEDLKPNITGNEFLNQLVKDSIDFIYSSVKNNEKKIPVDNRFYFYFKNNDLSKLDLVNNIQLIDTVSRKSYKPVFNWYSDSLLEIFSIDKFKNSSVIKLIIDLQDTKRKYLYELFFKVAGEKDYGEVSGKVVDRDTLIAPIYIELFNKDNSLVNYSRNIENDSVFVFENVFEGVYRLFSFIDENNDGVFDRGNYFPFKPSERFIVYPDINLNGGWSVDNIYIRF